MTFKIWHILWPGDVIDDVMSAWNITCTTRHPQQCTCKILFVWHQSFIVKSSGQTSWFINEYRGPTLRPPCDVIDDVIIMKILSFGIIWDDLFISEVKLKLCLIFKNFQNGHYFELAPNFFTGSYTRSWIEQKDSHERFRHFELLIDALAQILTEIYDF